MLYYVLCKSDKIYKGKNNNTPFAIPMIWHDPRSHLQTAVLLKKYQGTFK